MDGTTEPILAIIGHPIAGNPTQFALESGFAAAQMDCRVLSIDLAQDQVAPAIAGMDAMGFRGVWVTPTCQTAVANSLDTAPIESQTEERTTPILLDFLTRNPLPQSGSAWLPHAVKTQVWAKLASNALQKRGRGCAKIWWVDAEASLLQTNRLLEKNVLLHQMQQAKQAAWADWTVDQIEIVEAPSQIEQGDDDEDQVIVFARTGELPAKWQMPDQSVTIDLNENWDVSHLARWDQIKSSSTGVCIRSADVHAACLSQLTTLLFGLHVDNEVFLEAIDEYLAV